MALELEDGAGALALAARTGRRGIAARLIDAGAPHMKIGGRILSVGAIGELDAMMTGNVRGMKQYLRIPARELTMGGMLMYNHIDKLPEAWMSLNAMLATGKLKRAETIVRGGLERWAECVDHVYASQTFGRMILAVDAA